MRHTIFPTACVSAVALCAACDATTPHAFQLAALEIDVARCAFGQPFTIADAELQNAYFPLHVGRQWMLAGEEDGAAIALTITVLNQTETVGGVETRVVEEIETVDGTTIEVSRNFFAEALDGTVCYFGEDVDITEPGQPPSSAGAWRADDPGHFPGIIMPANPRPGQSFQMEGAPLIAEDRGRIIGSGPVQLEAGSFPTTIRIRETNPLDGGFDFKTFAAGVGIIIDGPLVLVSYSPGP